MNWNAKTYRVGKQTVLLMGGFDRFSQTKTVGVFEHDENKF